MNGRRSLKHAATEIELLLSQARMYETDAQVECNTAIFARDEAKARRMALEAVYELVKPVPRRRKAAKPSAAPVSV